MWSTVFNVLLKVYAFKKVVKAYFLQRLEDAGQDIIPRAPYKCSQCGALNWTITNETGYEAGWHVSCMQCRHKWNIDG